MNARTKVWVTLKEDYVDLKSAIYHRDIKSFPITKKKVNNQVVFFYEFRNVPLTYVFHVQVEWTEVLDLQFKDNFAIFYFNPIKVSCNTAYF